MNLIMSRMANPLVSKKPVDEEMLHSLGVSLITNYSSIEATAREHNISVAYFNYLLKTEEILQAYHEIAHEGVKGLTDSHLIQGLRDGNPDIIRFVAARMYAGRAKGGFNISELGTRGYKDPLGKKLAAETEKDRNKSSIRVEFNFVQREVRKHSKIDMSDDMAVDAEFVDVEDDDKQ